MTDPLAKRRLAIAAEAEKMVGKATDFDEPMDLFIYCTAELDESSDLYPDTSALKVWNESSMLSRVQGLDVVEGDLMFWQLIDRPDYHVGIVVKVTGPGRFETIEWNQDDGVCRQVRDVGGSSMMRVKGFLRVWVNARSHSRRRK